MNEPLLFRTIEFAVLAHKTQYRKGTKWPYIVHPLDVGNILIKSGCSEEIVAAGILHDTLEDTPTTYQQLVENFGKIIADLVVGASEHDKRDSWENRKLHTINHLKSAELDVVLVAAADKLSNFTFTYVEYSRIGDKIWDRFNQGKEKQKWYMQSLASVFMSRFDDKDNRTVIFKKVEKIVKRIFEKINFLEKEAVIETPPYAKRKVL